MSVVIWIVSGLLALWVTAQFTIFDEIHPQWQGWMVKLVMFMALDVMFVAVGFLIFMNPILHIIFSLIIIAVVVGSLIYWMLTRKPV